MRQVFCCNGILICSWAYVAQQYPERKFKARFKDVPWPSTKALPRLCVNSSLCYPFEVEFLPPPPQRLRYFTGRTYLNISRFVEESHSSHGQPLHLGYRHRPNTGNAQRMAIVGRIFQHCFLAQRKYRDKYSFGYALGKLSLSSMRQRYIICGMYVLHQPLYVSIFYRNLFNCLTPQGTSFLKWHICCYHQINGLARRFE